MPTIPSGLSNRGAGNKPFQFGLGSLLGVVWIAAAALAFWQYGVLWPTWLTYLWLILVIDNQVSGDFRKLGSARSMVLLALMQTTFWILVLCGGTLLRDRLS